MPDNDILSPEEKLLRLIQGDDASGKPSPEEKLLAASRGVEGPRSKVAGPKEDKKEDSQDDYVRTMGKAVSGKGEEAQRTEDRGQMSEVREVEAKPPEVESKPVAAEAPKPRILTKPPTRPVPSRAASAMASMADLVGNIGAGGGMGPSSPPATTRHRLSSPPTAPATPSHRLSSPPTAPATPSHRLSSPPTAPATPSHRNARAASAMARMAGMADLVGNIGGGDTGGRKGEGIATKRHKEAQKEFEQPPAAAGKRVEGPDFAKAPPGKPRSKVTGPKEEGESGKGQGSFAQGATEPRVASGKGEEAGPPMAGKGEHRTSNIERPTSKVGEPEKKEDLSDVLTTVAMAKEDLSAGAKGEAAAAGKGEHRTSNIERPTSKVKGQKEPEAVEEDLPDIEEVGAAVKAGRPAFLTHRDVLLDEELEAAEAHEKPGLIGTTPAILMQKRKNALGLGVGTVSRFLAAAALFVVCLTGFETWRDMAAGSLPGNDGPGGRVDVPAAQANQPLIPPVKVIERVREKDIFERSSGLVQTVEVTDTGEAPPEWVKTAKEMLNVVAIAVMPGEGELSSRERQAIVKRKEKDQSKTLFLRKGDTVEVSGQELTVSLVSEKSITLFDGRNSAAIE